MKYNVKITNKKTNKVNYAFYSAVNKNEIRAYLLRNDKEENKEFYTFEIIEIDIF